MLSSTSRPTRSTFIRGGSRFVNSTYRVSSLSRTLTFIRAVHSRRPGTHRITCTTIYNNSSNHLTRHVDSSNRPSNATNGPVLSILHTGRVASYIITIAQCFKNVLLNSKNLVHTCSANTSVTIGTTGGTGVIPYYRCRIALSCPRLKDFRGLLTSISNRRTSTRCASHVILSVVIPRRRSRGFGSQVVRAFGTAIAPQRANASGHPIQC